MTNTIDTLREKGITVTHHRLEILKYLEANMDHPTAEMIFSTLKKDNPSLSRTTIYNTLDTFREHGLVITLSISELEVRYDINTEMHHHFLCKECGKISDINVKCPFLDSMLNGGNRVEEVHGYFKGICEECLEKEAHDDKKDSER